MSGESTAPLLSIRGLRASVDGTPILNGVDLRVEPGEVHAVMGRNGSGKSTTANVLMGHPDYEVDSGEIEFMGEDLLEMEPWERARAGLFLSFQYPLAVPGLQVGGFLRKTVAAIRGEEAAKGPGFRDALNDGMQALGLDCSFLSRYVNDGFSGGEKKRFEILQMHLVRPRLAILDETDSGLDIDGIRTVAAGIESVVRGSPDTGAIIITHYDRILEHVRPDRIHVLIAGRIVRSGGPELANELEARGYDWIEEAAGAAAATNE